MNSRDKLEIEYLLFSKVYAYQTWQGGESREFMLQIENLLPLLPQGLWPPNMADWQLMVKEIYLWSRNILWQHVVTWQIKSITYLFWQGLWPWNLASYWLLVRWKHPWSHSRRLMATKLCRVLTNGEAKPIMKLHDSDHVITCQNENWISPPLQSLCHQMTRWWKTINKVT